MLHKKKTDANTLADDECEDEEYKEAQEKLKVSFSEIFDIYQEKKKADEEDLGENEQSFKFAYITFRQMDAMDLILKAYDIPLY